MPPNLLFAFKFKYSVDGLITLQWQHPSCSSHPSWLRRRSRGLHSQRDQIGQALLCLWPRLRAEHPTGGGLRCGGKKTADSHSRRLQQLHLRLWTNWLRKDLHYDGQQQRNDATLFCWTLCQNWQNGRHWMYCHLFILRALQRTDHWFAWQNSIAQKSEHQAGRKERHVRGGAHWGGSHECWKIAGMPQHRHEEQAHRWDTDEQRVLSLSFRLHSLASHKVGNWGKKSAKNTQIALCGSGRLRETEDDYGHWRQA